MVAVKFHSWSVKIHGWPSDNCISIFGCPAIALVVPGARTTKILNAVGDPPSVSECRGEAGPLGLTLHLGQKRKQFFVRVNIFTLGVQCTATHSHIPDYATLALRIELLCLTKYIIFYMQGDKHASCMQLSLNKWGKDLDMNHTINSQILSVVEFKTLLHDTTDTR